ncbi:hypothetical protein [Gimesia maris]|jgi:hypothetical protein|tara:strand:- start:18759 stop:18959 length:201 start_codon:yes stop_codon:yes gene_type:complete
MMSLIQLFVFHLVLFIAIGLLLAVFVALNQILLQLRAWLRSSEVVPRLHQSLPGKMPRQFRGHASH